MTTANAVHYIAVHIFKPAKEWIMDDVEYTVLAFRIWQPFTII